MANFVTNNRRRLHLRRRHNDICLSCQNSLRYTLDMWDKESIVPGK